MKAEKSGNFLLVAGLFFLATLLLPYEGYVWAVFLKKIKLPFA
jgi:cytochrome bd-type quinol oxidase subunit 2